jgi:hypothetical protein
VADDDQGTASVPAVAPAGGPGAHEPGQDELIAAHEAAHGPLPGRILAELRSGAKQGGAAGKRAVDKVGGATEALHLEVVETRFEGARALAGHALGMRLLIPAEGVHGPRETAALLYLFRDAIAVRPTDDAPMSAIPLYGLHIVMPHVAVARWVYKAGRTAHANLGLEREQQEFQSSLADWTVDDFRQADDKVEVFEVSDLAGPVHVYQHLGLVRLELEVAGHRLLRMKSALPESAATFVRLWQLFAEVLDTSRLTMEIPTHHDDEGSSPGA